MGTQLRAADPELLEMLNSYGDRATNAAVLAERALLAELHGGYSVLVGAYAMAFASKLKAYDAGHVARWDAACVCLCDRR